MQQETIINNNNLYSLSILIHQDGLSFYIHTQGKDTHSIERKFKYASNPIEILKSIEDCYETENLLQQSFKAVKLIYHHPIFALVPNQFFKEDNTADYLKYNTRLLQTDTISHDDPIEKINARIVYIAYSNLNNFFYDKYGDHNYYHYSSLMLPVIFKNGDGLYIEIMPSHFYITVINNLGILAHNIFPYEQVEDVLYYTLFAMEQYQQDPETCAVTLIDKRENQELFDLLYKYIRHVKTMENYMAYQQDILCA